MTLREFYNKLRNKGMSNRLISPTAKLLFSSDHTLIDKHDRSLSLNQGNNGNIRFFEITPSLIRFKGENNNGCLDTFISIEEPHNRKPGDKVEVTTAIYATDGSIIEVTARPSKFVLFAPTIRYFGPSTVNNFMKSGLCQDVFDILFERGANDKSDKTVDLKCGIMFYGTPFNEKTLMEYIYEKDKIR